MSESPGPEPNQIAISWIVGAKLPKSSLFMLELYVYASAEIEFADRSVREPALEDIQAMFGREITQAVIDEWTKKDNLRNIFKQASRKVTQYRKIETEESRRTLESDVGSFKCVQPEDRRPRLQVV